MSNFKFFDDNKTHLGNSKEVELPNPKAVIDEHLPFGNRNYRYRTQQLQITKFDGIVINNGTTKREFFVSKIDNGPQLEIGVKLVDNVIQFNPTEMEDAIALLCDIDNIKCDIRATINNESGKIDSILNKSEIINNWHTYKNMLSEKYSFVRKSETAANIEKFIKLVDLQINNEQLFIDDIETKLFIELLFDKYLVGKEYFEPYTKQFGSHLFEDNLLTFNFIQNVTYETPDFVEVERISSVDRTKIDIRKIEKQYDIKFKPIINYKFSDFDFTINQKIKFNIKENIIETANVIITEEVKNNVQLIVNYELKRVDL